MIFFYINNKFSHKLACTIAHTGQALRHTENESFHVGMHFPILINIISLYCAFCLNCSPLHFFKLSFSYEWIFCCNFFLINMCNHFGGYVCNVM